MVTPVGGHANWAMPFGATSTVSNPCGDPTRDTWATSKGLLLSPESPTRTLRELASMPDRARVGVLQTDGSMIDVVPLSSPNTSPSGLLGVFILMKMSQAPPVAVGSFVKALDGMVSLPGLSMTP